MIDQLTEDLSALVGAFRLWPYSHRGLSFDNAAMIADHVEKLLDELACCLKTVVWI